MLDTRNLTHLSMLGCFEIPEYTEDLGVEAQRNGTKLEHLALVLIRPEDLEDYLGDLLNATKHMKSLHVQWDDEEIPSPQSLMDKICAIGPRLELLSLQECWRLGRRTDDNERDPNIMAMQVQMVVDKIFGTLHRHQSCPKLGAIVFGHIKAFPMKRDDISDDDDDDDDDDDEDNNVFIMVHCPSSAS
jgi:hypothetical protein